MTVSSAIICPLSGLSVRLTFSSFCLVSPHSQLQCFLYFDFVKVILAYFTSNETAPTKNSTPIHLASAIRFDRRVAAISLFMDASANVLIAISPTSSQALFVFLTSLNSLTSGGLPALQSLGAVSLRAMGKGNEMGLVFGALGLSNAVSHIIAVRPRLRRPLLGPSR